MARHVIRGLEQESFTVWWDQALTAGEAFDSVTERALEESPAAVGAPEQAAAILRAHLQELNDARFHEAGNIALWAAYLGDRELTLDALEMFSRSASSPPYQLLWYPLLGEARRDPRFKRIMERMGFASLWRRTGQWADACRPVGDDDFECR
jgi:hypothetical protein